MLQPTHKDGRDRSWGNKIKWTQIICKLYALAWGKVAWNGEEEASRTTRSKNGKSRHTSNPMTKACAHPQLLIEPQPEPDAADCRVEAAQSGSHIGIRIRHKHKYTNIKTDTDDSTYSWYGLHAGSCTSSSSFSCSLSLSCCRYKD